MIEILQNYWQGMVLAILLTSLFLSILNRFNPMQKVNDGWLVAGMSFVFTVLTTSFTKLQSFADFQAIAIRVLITAAFCYLFSMTKGQSLVDNVLNWAAGKANDMIGKDNPPPPPATP